MLFSIAFLRVMCTLLHIRIPTIMSNLFDKFNYVFSVSGSIQIRIPKNDQDLQYGVLALNIIYKCNINITVWCILPEYMLQVSFLRKITFLLSLVWKLLIVVTYISEGKLRHIQLLTTVLQYTVNITFWKTRFPDVQ